MNLYDSLTDQVREISGEDAFAWMVKGNKIAEQGGLPVIHGEIGQLDFKPFATMIDGTLQSINDNMTGYGPTAGLPALRQAIADYSNRLHGYNVEPGQVILAMGAKAILYATLEAFINPGDKVVFFEPGYPIYVAVTKMRRGIPVPVPLRPENNFIPDLKELDRLAAGAKLLIVNSPQNPIGSVFPEEVQRVIAEIACKHNLIVISDEAYSRMLYDGKKFVSITQFPGMAERTIIDDSLSKTGSVPGYRLGWGIVPLGIAKEMTTILGNIYSCCPAFTQAGAIEVLTDVSGKFDSYVSGMVEVLQKRRDLLLDEIEKIPQVKCFPPQGAFYLWLDIRSTGLSSNEFAERFLNEYHVVSLPGTSFGDLGEGFVRVSFGSLQPDDITEFSKRLHDFVNVI